MAVFVLFSKVASEVLFGVYDARRKGPLPGLVCRDEPTLWRGRHAGGIIR